MAASVGNEDRIKRSIKRLARTAVPEIDYLAYYEATVQAQAADGTLGVKPVDARLPDMANLPVKLGIPGATVKVGPGATVMIGFKNGDPSQAYVHSWNPGDFTIQLNLKASTIILNDGVLGVARQTDTVTGQAGPFPLANGMITTASTSVKAG